MERVSTGGTATSPICWGPRSASGRRTSWTRKSGRLSTRRSAPPSSSWNTRSLDLNLAQLTTATCRLAVSLPAPPTAVGPSRDEGYSIPRWNIRPVQAAAPRRTRLRLSVHGLPEAGSRASQPVWMGSSGRRRALSRRWRSSAHGPGRCYRRPEGAAASTDAGRAQAIVRPGDDCRRVEQCLTTPGTRGIFQC